MKKKSVWFALVLVLVLPALNVSAADTAHSIILSWQDAVMTWISAALDALTWWGVDPALDPPTLSDDSSLPPISGFGPGVVPNG